MSLLNVDCANGVGAPKLARLLEVMGKGVIEVRQLNGDIKTAELLNKDCGADFVKVEQTTPSGVSAEQARERCCSLDGDADRVVFYYVDGAGKFHLLDGDKIAALAAGYFKELVQQVPALDGKIQIGVVQTAYANGSSTAYFESRGIPVACTETGVKHLHHRAEEFDIGVYFEANGHGTVLFKPSIVDLLRKTLDASSPDAKQERRALITLLAFVDLINQCVGDALSDMLMVEAILTLRQWTFDHWRKMYTDLPNRQLKVKVGDRLAFRTTNADRQLVAPAGLQAVVDGHVGKVARGRAFVRPSGTEDVVRIYAEAETQELCDTLAYTLAGEVFDRAGGVGERPAKP